MELRLEFHQTVEKRKFTHKTDDWILFFDINCESKEQAFAIEKHIKKMKSYIQNLVKCPEIRQNYYFFITAVNDSPDSNRDWFEPIACPENFQKIVAKV